MTFGLASPAGAATEVIRTDIRGPLIQAQADVVDGCIEQHLFVQAFVDDQGRPFVVVLDSRVDICGGDSGSFAEGTATPEVLDVRPNLSTGRLVASVPMVFSDGTSAGTVALDLTFTGTGPISRQHIRQTVRDPGGTSSTSTDHSTSRAATVAGTPDLVFEFAAVAIVRQGEFVRTHT